MLERTQFITDKQRKKNIELYGIKIGDVDKKGKINYLKKKNKQSVDTFKELLKEAKNEYEKTADAAIKEKIGVDIDENSKESIKNDSILDIQNKIDRKIRNNNLKDLIDKEDDQRRSLFHEDDLREFRGLIYLDNLDPNLSESEKRLNLIGKIDGFETEYNYWKDKADLEIAEPQKSIYKSFAEIAKLQADKLRIENNERPVGEEGINLLNENSEQSDLGRLERFKKRCKG